MLTLYTQSSSSSTGSPASSPQKPGDRFISARLGPEAHSTFDTKSVIFDCKGA